MGLFDNIRQKRELEKLEKAARETPSANTLSALIKKYRELEDVDNALRVARLAIEKFPESELLFDIYSRLRKGQAYNEIETLKKIIEERPNPAAFAQLAEIYKDLRDEEEAFKYCRRAIELFPNDDSPYLIIGELRLIRFYKDFLLKDGQIALTNLEKAFDINNKNYKSLLALAKFYLQIGALTKARQRLKGILLFAPEDDNVKKLQDALKEVSKPPHEDIDILLQEVEDRRALYYTLDKKEVKKTTPVVLSPEIFQKPLESLDQIGSIQCLLVCDEDGNLVAHHAKEGIDINTYYEVATAIHQTVKDSSRQMDIGRFQRGQIEGPFGNIHIMGAEGVIYIAFGKSDEKAEHVYKHLQRFISRVSFLLK